MRHSLWLGLAVLALSANAARGEEPADVLAKAPSKFAAFGDKKVHYKSLGEGKTALVFVHGWCCDHSVWHHQAAALSGKVRMLFVDLPGYGKSDRPDGDPTMDVFARGIDAVLRNAGVERAVLAGHSMGTPVVRQFYRLFPEKTKALVFVDGALRPTVQSEAEAEKFLSMFTEENFREAAPKFLTAMLPPDAPASMREHLERLVSGTDPRVAVRSMRAMFDEKLWKDDPVKVPAQALMAKSPFWTEDYKKFARKLVPGLDYREFDGVGHFLFMEKPEEFNAALVEFLKKQGVLPE
ncbi:MAG TPA: alpha/beta hydrolase [Gemmataceae bacterium]